MIPPRCTTCGRFTTWPPAATIPIRDSVHPYTADYAYLCARCAADKEETDL